MKNEIDNRYYQVKLSTRELYEVQTLAEASHVCMAYIAANDYGSSDLCRGFGVVKLAGKPVARISYNGRIWNNDGNEILTR